jgi:hypothetical protein
MRSLPTWARDDTSAQRFAELNFSFSTVSAFFCLLSTFALAEVTSDFATDVGAELRAFPSEPAFDVQLPVDVSMSIQPRFALQWENRRQTLEISPFFRYDNADPRRTHFDVADFSYVKAWENFELRLGVRKVFWGVTESQHLVDVINQLDFVEDFMGKTKLGQPMINPVLIAGDLGTFELFVMPYFRDRTYPSLTGHFRPQYFVNVDAATFQSTLGRFNPDLAFRWSDRIGAIDIGLSHFFGTNRLPVLVENVPASGIPELDPEYDLMQQSGFDFQVTLGGLLGKLEMITRGDQNYQNVYFAATVGGEYTIPQIFGALDVGLLLEYLYDSRGLSAPVAFEDDFFVGMRLALNDSGGFSFLMGGIIDRENYDQIYFLETSRRLGNTWKVGVKGGLFNVSDTTDPLYTFAQDNFVQLDVTYFIF